MSENGDRDAGQQIRLRVGGLSKRFGPNLALDGVSLDVRRGEVYGLIGQNGSGKSTLTKVLAGYHVPEPDGTVEIDGTALRMPPRPKELLSAGIAFVHQDLGLLDHMTVMDNICVGNLEASRILRRVQWAREAERARRVLAGLRVDIDPARLAGDLGAEERAIVAIARGLLRLPPSGGLIVLDEATRALPEHSLAEVHRVMREIAHQGGSVVLVSHNLDEVMAVTDRVAVFRDGRVVTAGLETTSTDKRELARMMLGYDVRDDEFHVAGVADDVRPTLSIRSLAGRQIESLDLEVKPGEIVGITGLNGSGFEDLPALLSGAAPSSGHLQIRGRAIPPGKRSIRAMLGAGVVVIPERRERDGLAFDMTVEDNITFPRLHTRGTPWFVGNKWRREEAGWVVDLLDVRPRDPSLLVRQLSGGNQQKVLLGKWLASKPDLMVLHEPTQAVDVGARRDILEAVHSAAQSGVAVVIASAEIGDLAAICHRVIIMRAGRAAALQQRPTRDEILRELHTDAMSDQPTATSNAEEGTA
ncbi:sugar ABC transporter ATP-binding protein [Nonomuraea sp. NPDC050783]|uniref:sugar ABC transporter ATP-binding protein n=1 Tax=Nonomuraea sp. NPDC050783 TaxID=3154634 RepID=UPI003466D7C7